MDTPPAFRVVVVGPRAKPWPAARGRVAQQGRGGGGEGHARAQRPARSAAPAEARAPAAAAAQHPSAQSCSAHAQRPHQEGRERRGNGPGSFPSQGGAKSLPGSAAAAPERWTEPHRAQRVDQRRLLLPCLQQPALHRDALVTQVPLPARRRGAARQRDGRALTPFAVAASQSTPRSAASGLPTPPTPAPQRKARVREVRGPRQSHHTAAKEGEEAPLTVAPCTACRAAGQAGTGPGPA